MILAFFWRGYRLGPSQELDCCGDCFWEWCAAIATVPDMGVKLPLMLLSVDQKRIKGERMEAEKVRLDKLLDLPYL